MIAALKIVLIVMCTILLIVIAMLALARRLGRAMLQAWKEHRL